MGKKTINQALKDLFLGLGGDSSALADNSSVSDYIEDLESAIKGQAGGAQIDDETASTDTVYSSSKTEDLIEANALPSVAVGDIGEALIVESDGEGGAQWGKGAIPAELPTVSASDNGKVLGVDNGSWGAIDAPSKIVVFDCDISSPMRDGSTITLKNNKYLRDVSNAINDGYIVYLRLGAGTGSFMGDYDFCGFDSVSGSPYNQFFKQVVSYDSSTGTNKLYTYLIILQSVTVGGQNTGTIKILQESVVS